MSLFLVQLDRVWTAYPDDVQQALYEAYIDGTKVVELVMQSDPTIKYMRFYSKYFIDFSDMKQYNAYTNKTRKIKLVASEETESPQLKGKLAKIVATTCVPNKEKYTVEETTEEERQISDDCALILTRMKNVWLMYGPDVLAALQRAYCAGYAMVEFVVLSDPGVEHMKYYSKYVVDFTAMTQYNVYTEKSRKIRFVSKEDKDKNTYETAPGKLAKDVHAVKTLGTEVPRNLGTKNLEILAQQIEGQGSPSSATTASKTGAKSRGKGRSQRAPRAELGSSEQICASPENRRGHKSKGKGKGKGRQRASSKVSKSTVPLSEVPGFTKSVLAASTLSMSQDFF